MRIALAQINPTIGDFSGNFQIISRFYEQAARQDVELVIFPEMATAGYPAADLLEKETFVRSAEESLHRLAKLTSGANRPAMLVGSPMRCQQDSGKRVRNVAAVLEGGEIRFTQTKRLLPFYDVFDEQRYFEPASRQSLTKIKDHAAAITVCEDAWNDKMFWPQRFYPNDPVEELMKQWAVLPQPLSGHRLILNISASPYSHGKPAVRRRMIRALAERHGATVVIVNQVGANDSLVFDGDSFAMNPRGEVIAQAKEFEEDLVIFDSVSAQPVTISHRNEAIAESAKMPGGEAECERTWKALVLGTRDYLHKCGFKKALLGLSGGIDSALVAAIAVEALGAENVRGIGMPSEFSSEGSVTDAERLAKNLGIKFDVVPVRAIFEQFSHALEPFFNGTSFGLAEENLQPRIRGNLLMALSNKQGGLVLTTGNKSEMATGYCTLYGDMVGALAVIGDLYKTEVYALSRYANREREIIPQETIDKEPSAELRPGQKDTDSLPPYEVLDPILRAYVEDYRSADEIAAMRNVSPELVQKIIRLVELAEYKRQQAAPVLKVSKKAFGMGRRFPIAARREV